MKSILNTQLKLLGQQQIAIIFSFSLVVLISIFSSYNLYSVFGIGLTIFIALRLMIVMDETIPVIEIMLLISASQWIIGPFIDYQTKVNHYKMHMYVSEQRYMELTIPLFFVFFIASIQFSKFITIDREAIKKFLEEHKALPIYIILVGFISQLINPFLPSSLAFIGFLAINSSLIGLGLFYFTQTSKLNKFLITGVVFLPILFQTISSGMFHILIIWGIFTFIFVNLTKRITFLNKVIIISFSIFFLFTLQSVKKDYREIIYDTSFNGNKLELFVNLLMGDNSAIKNSQKRENEDVKENNVNVRLNQGWIISKIYDRIPEKKDFIGGETIIEAIEATLLPRFLFPDKKTGGGGKATFEKLTGFTLLDTTAMGASLMGEFYGNFGFYGGLLAFLIWGRILNFVVMIFQKIQKTSPIIVFWLPIVFFQVIKAETDLTTVLNHLVKSIIFVTLFMFFIKKLLPSKVLNKSI
jgi:hypothetical protein